MDIQLFLLLLAGHYLADFSLQSRFMADAKKLVFIESNGFHALTAHAFVHGLVAGLLSQNFQVALLVGVTHWLIDFIRSSKWLARNLKVKARQDGLFGIHLDQTLHILIIAIAVTIHS